MKLRQSLQKLRGAVDDLGGLGEVSPARRVAALAWSLTAPEDRDRGAPIVEDIEKLVALGLGQRVLTDEQRGTLHSGTDEGIRLALDVMVVGIGRNAGRSAGRKRR